MDKNFFIEQLFKIAPTLKESDNLSDAVGELFHTANVVDRLFDEGFLDEKGMLKVEEQDVPDWAMLLYQDTESSESSEKTDDTSESKIRNGIEKFLSEFPDNATSWKDATDEIADVYEALLEFVNSDGEVFKDINTTRAKTPAEFVKKFKDGIRALVKMLTDEELERALSSYLPWFE